MMCVQSLESQRRQLSRMLRGLLCWPTLIQILMGMGRGSETEIWEFR